MDELILECIKDSAKVIYRDYSEEQLNRKVVEIIIELGLYTKGEPVWVAI